MINKAQIQWKVQKLYKPTKPKPFTMATFPKIHRDHLWFNICAFVFGLASIKGLYPFGLSFVAAAGIYQKKYSWAAVFSFLGVIVGTRSLQSLRYGVALLIFIVAFKLLPEVLKRRDYLAAILVFASNAMAGGLFLLNKGLSPYDLVFLFMESCLSAVTVFVLPGGLPWVFKTSAQTAEKAICFALMAGVILPILSVVELVGINLREVLGVVSVMTMALIDGPGAGASTGVILGLIGFSSVMSPWAMALLAFSGLVAGSFNKLGKFGVFAGFTLGYLLFNLYVNSMGEILISFPVLLVSFALVLFIPRSMQKSLEMNIGQFREESWEPRDITNLGASKLYEVAVTLEELAKAFDDGGIFQGEVGAQNSVDYIDRIYQQVKVSICSACHLKKICWEMEPRKTARAFYELINSFEAGGPRGKLPELFKTRCGSTEVIFRLIGSEAYALNLQRQAKEIVDLNRQLIKGHYRGAAVAMKELAQNLPREQCHPHMDTRLKARLMELGVRVEDLQCREEAHHCTISLVKGPCIGQRQCDELIPQGLTQILGDQVNLRIVDCPQKSGNPKCRILARTQGSLAVMVGVTGTAKEGDSLSGDGFSFMELENGQYLLALSDGMGVGKKAAKHSEKTLTMVERLFETGFDSDTALKIVNSTLLATAAEEGFSTLDVALIDTYTGQTRFIKSGAPSSYIIKKGSKLQKITGGSLPVGILEGISPKITELKLSAGDIVIMVTDGIVDALSAAQGGEEVLCKLLSTLNTRNPREMAEEILSASKRAGIKDDMTVMVAGICERI